MFRKLGIIIATSALFACARSRVDSAAGMADTSGRISSTVGQDPGIVVLMRDAAARDLGSLSLTETSAGLSLSGNLRGLPPGIHAIHLHMVGACQTPFESAGSHWNPTSRQHGRENPQGPHMGDLPNITVATDSTVMVRVTTPGGSLRGQDALLDSDGAAVVIHSAADDNRTNPSGNSGARIACGIVIRP